MNYMNAYNYGIAAIKANPAKRKEIREVLDELNEDVANGASEYMSIEVCTDMTTKGFTVKERHRTDISTKERLEDCANRKGKSVADLVRMAWQFWTRIRHSDSLPSLTYRTGQKTQFLEIQDLAIPDDCEDDFSAVVNYFLDQKDDGKSNGQGQRGQAQKDGSTILDVTQLGRTIEAVDGFTHAVSGVAMDMYVYTFCSPHEPYNCEPYAETASTVGAGVVTCPTCQAMLEAARQFPIMQYTELEV